MSTLRNDYKLCKTEVSSMKRDQSSKRVTRSMSKKIKDDGEVDNDPRKAMFAAIQSRGSQKKDDDSPPQSPKSSGDPMQALFAAIKNKKNVETSPKEGDSEAPSDVTYSSGVTRLQKFLSHSKTILSLAERDQDKAIRACKVCFVLRGGFVLFVPNVNQKLHLIALHIFVPTAGPGSVLRRGRRRASRRTAVASSI